MSKLLHNNNSCFRLDSRFIFLLSKNEKLFDIEHQLIYIFQVVQRSSKSFIKSLTKTCIDFSHKVKFDSNVASHNAIMYSVQFTNATLVNILKLFPQRYHKLVFFSQQRIIKIYVIWEFCFISKYNINQILYFLSPYLSFRCRTKICNIVYLRSFQLVIFYLFYCRCC